MKKIINPWRNHEGYNCFGCSPDNPIGLHMEFYEDGDYIVSTWHPEHNYQGWVDTMHGGILSTLIDEVCGWVVTRKLQTSGYTVSVRMGSHQETTDQRLYRAVECEVPQGSSDNGARIDHTGQSDKTGEKPCLYQCGDHQFEG